MTIVRQVEAPALDLFLLRGEPEAVAIVAPERTFTYAELAAAVTAEARVLGPEPRLVVVEARNDIRTVVRCLAALAGHHPLLLIGADDRDRSQHVRETYEHADDLHPDLGVLLSTSGSTGSPKLVRLSRDNVAANAASIATYLGIRADDRAITSLPLHYCYGLSVLTSHLWAGAAVVLTELSVADECFWTLASREKVSSFAGVPFTFDLLDATGFAERDLPHLRYVTQAGGRMAPEHVVRYAELGRSRGWDLVVMYGQTEATARMAYLPPDLARARPETIGVPVPGGSFHLVPADGHDLTGTGVGELVYRGPNVMMGYAESAADLARGPELRELRTGDLARRAPDGLWEIVGRLNRQAKVFGLRLDLGRLEEQVGGCRIVADGETLHVFTTRPRQGHRLRADVGTLSGLPLSAVHVHRLAAMPSTPTGKVDHGALVAHARAAVRDQPAESDDHVTPEVLRDLYAVLLGRPRATVDDSFVSLGGDSLSFVEVSSRVGRLLGRLPVGWQHHSIAELAAVARPPRRRLTAPLEMSVLLRAVALLMVVVAHVDLAPVEGGAHVLLAVVGFNLARFGGAVPGRATRLRRMLGSAAAVAVPSVLWIASVALVTGQYRPATALLLNGALGGSGWSDQWQFWFLEAALWTTVACALVLALPPVDRWQRAHRFAAPVTLLVLALGLRYAWTGVEAGPTERYSTLVVLWCFAAGWAAAEARTWGHRLLVVALTVLGVAGFFGDLQREAIVAVGITLLLWARPVLVPVAVATCLRVVASASLWIYLTHWQVYPSLEDAGHPYAALLASLVVGVAACWCYARTSRWLRQTPRSSASTMR